VRESTVYVEDFRGDRVLGDESPGDRGLRQVSQRVTSRHSSSALEAPRKRGFSFLAGADKPACRLPEKRQELLERQFGRFQEFRQR
jgi:hypothetical protein